MLRSIVALSLRFRFLVIAGAAAMLVLGAGELSEMPVDVFPEFAPPMVEIQTVSVGLSAADVESLVTVPLEEALAGVPHLDVIRSKSVPDLSSIKMIFETGADLLAARQVVQERLALVAPTLPSWAAAPVLLPPLSSTSRMMKIGISSEKLSVIELSMITYWTIRQRLLQIPGVANVAIWGERLQMLQVQVDPERMRRHGVQLDEVMEATADTLNVGLLQFSEGHVVGTGGWIETPNQRLPVRHVLPLIYRPEQVTPDHLARAVLRPGFAAQPPLRLSDVADVVIDHQPMIGDAIIDDDVGLLLIVEKFPWGNTLQVTRQVEEALDALRPGLPDVDIDHEIFRPATFIEMSLDNLTKALIIAALLVVAVLGAFLFEWRTALISATAIPLSLMAAALVLYLTGTTINTMVLAGLVIALGAVVDDAIVDVENIVRRLKSSGADTSDLRQLARVALEASLEVRTAIVYATLIEILALVPVFFMEGLSGAFFQPLAMAYALAIAASMIVATTVTPALSLILFRNAPLSRRAPPLVAWITPRYESALRLIVQRPRRTYLAIGGLALAGLLSVPTLGQELLPAFKERDFLMHWLAKPGTSWPEMQRITQLGSQELRSIPGVRNFGAHIGQALVMDEVVGMYFGENWISVAPDVDYDQTLEHIQRTVDGYPGLFRDVLTYLRERIREVLTGSSDAVVVRLYGRDLGTLRKLARDTRKAMADIDGLVELHTGFQEEIPQIEVKADLAAAQQYGLKPGDIRRAAARLVAGEEVGDIYSANRTHDVVVWSTPPTRDSLTALRELPIDTPSRGRVRLADVAAVQVRPVPNVIKRENLKRRLDVSANVRGRDLGAVYADVEAALTTVNFPLEYHAELLGEYTERRDAQSKIFVFAVASTVAIFLLLQTSFASTRLAALSFLLLPTALVGGVLAAVVSGGVISLGSLVGFLTVLGISARNGILMIQHFRHLEFEEGQRFGIDLVLRGARERLAPILMTATTTGLALVPLAIAGEVPGNEIEHPMALVILGGMTTSTLLNLFAIPPLYLRFGRGATTSQRVGN